MTEQTVVMMLESLMAESSRRFSDNEKEMKAKTWMLALNDITDEQGIVGFEKAVKMTNEFMPSVGKFRELCLSGTGADSIKGDALEAWALVMSRLNSYSSPVFKDSAIAETIRKMGGWKKLCTMLETDEPFRKKDFVELYQAMRRKNVEFNQALVGRFKDEVVFIGFDKIDNIDMVLEQIEKKTNSDNRMIEMMNGNQ